MRRGPKPKPAAVKAQKAPVRSKRKSAAVASGDAAETTRADGIAPPSWLNEDGRTIWNRLVPSLTQAKLLTVADVDTFGRYCLNFARWLKMQTVLDAESPTYTVETESGTVHRPRPEFMIADRIERQLLAAEDRFGLNPAERQRIFVARSQSGVTGDLFAATTKSPPKKSGRDDAATPPAAPASPTESPIGLLQ